MNRTIRSQLLASIVLTAGASASALANEQPGQFYVDGMATGIFADSDRRVDDGLAGGELALGYVLHRNWNLELYGQLFSLDGDKGGPDQDQTGLGLNVLNVYNREGNLSPYLIAGGGWVNTDPDGGRSQDNLQLQGGVGLKTDLGSSDRWSLRTEALYRWEDADGGDLGDILINIGIGYAFGDGPAPAAVPIAAAAAPAAVAAVDNTDSDGDGVPDRNDQCPDTPRGAVVDSVGCPLDSDNDGVYDGLDQCPGTIRGALVDDRGCAIQLSGVNFGFDSAELLPSAESRLDEALAKLREYPEVNIMIEGHTDSRGDAGYNQGLSERRAAAAKAYLVGRGIGANRITTVGRGESEPVASNETESGRAENRRVLLKVED